MRKCLVLLVAILLIAVATAANVTTRNAPARGAPTVTTQGIAIAFTAVTTTGCQPTEAQPVVGATKAQVISVSATNHQGGVAPLSLPKMENRPTTGTSGRVALNPSSSTIIANGGQTSRCAPEVVDLRRQQNTA